MASTKDIESRIFQIVGYKFNLLSNKQLIKAVYEDAGLPVIEKTSAGNPSTTEATLKKLSDDYELARLLLEYKKEAKKAAGKEEVRKAPKPGMPKERQVLARDSLVDELEKAPEEILSDEERKESARREEFQQAPQSQPSPAPFQAVQPEPQVQKPRQPPLGAPFASSSPARTLTLDKTPEESVSAAGTFAPESSKSAFPGVQEHSQTAPQAGASSEDLQFASMFAPSSADGGEDSSLGEPVTVSVAMEVPPEKDLVSAADSVPEFKPAPAPVPEPEPELKNEPEPENAPEQDSEPKVVSFGVSSSFTLSKDQENAHSVIRENESREQPKPQPKFDIDADPEPSENEFSRNSASLNVKKRVEEDHQTAEKSKVGLIMMVLVVILAVVIVAFGVNSLNSIG